MKIISRRLYHIICLFLVTIAIVTFNKQEGYCDVPSCDDPDLPKPSKVQNNNYGDGESLVVNWNYEIDWGNDPNLDGFQIWEKREGYTDYK